MLVTGGSSTAIRRYIRIYSTGNLGYSRSIFETPQYDVFDVNNTFFRCVNRRDRFATRELKKFAWLVTLTRASAPNLGKLYRYDREQPASRKLPKNSCNRLKLRRKRREYIILG